MDVYFSFSPPLGGCVGCVGGGNLMPPEIRTGVMDRLLDGITPGTNAGRGDEDGDGGSVTTLWPAGRNGFGVDGAA